MCSSVVYHGVSLGERGGGQPNDRKQSRTDRNRTEKSPETHGESILIVLSVAVVLLGGSTAAAVVIYAKKNRLF